MLSKCQSGLTRYQYINQRQRDLVNGYIKEQQEQLFSNVHNNAYYNLNSIYSVILIHFAREPQMNANYATNKKKLVIISSGNIPLLPHSRFDFFHCKLGMERKVSWKHFDMMLLIIPTNTTSKKKQTMIEACKKAKKCNPKLFICIIDVEASESAVFRSKCFHYGANMVTNDHHSLKKVLHIIGHAAFYVDDGTIPIYICPYCNMKNLTEDQLWHHVPLYHVNDGINVTIYCPICNEQIRRKYLQHLRNNHGPVRNGELAPEHRNGILTHTLSSVGIRRPTDDKWLLVQQASSSGYMFPGGPVEVGETLQEAAVRVTKQKAGIKVDIKGVLKIQHFAHTFDDGEKGFNGMKVIFYAEPMHDKRVPKTVPNYDGAGATYISIEELDEIELKDDEENEIITAFNTDYHYYPLDILACFKHDHRSYNDMTDEKSVSSEDDADDISDDISDDTSDEEIHDDDAVEKLPSNNDQQMIQNIPTQQIQQPQEHQTITYMNMSPMPHQGFQQVPMGVNGGFPQTPHSLNNQYQLLQPTCLIPISYYSPLTNPQNPYIPSTNLMMSPSPYLNQSQTPFVHIQQQQQQQQQPVQYHVNQQPVSQNESNYHGTGQPHHAFPMYMPQNLIYHVPQHLQLQEQPSQQQSQQQSQPTDNSKDSNKNIKFYKSLSL